MRHQNSKINGIVAILDNEDEARLIFRYSVMLAKKLDLPLVLFKTMNATQVIGAAAFAGENTALIQPSSDLRVITRNSVESDLEEMKAEALQQHNIMCDYTLREGFATDEMLNFLEEFKSFLPVISMGNHAAIYDIWFGSKAQTIIMNAPNAVYLVPKNGPLTVPRYFLYATHGKRQEREEMDDMGVLESLTMGLNGIIKFAEFSKHEDPIKTIENNLSTFAVDCLALHAKEKGFFERIFNPGPALKMLSRTDLPMLVMHKINQ